MPRPGRAELGGLALARRVGLRVLGRKVRRHLWSDVVCVGVVRPVREDDPPVPRGALPAGTTIAEEIPSEAGADSRIAVSRGDTLELEVTGNTLDTVLLERLDRIDPIDPTTPARFNLVIDAPAGSYPIRLVEADRRIGSIVISD